MKNYPKISDAEWQVMDALWAKSPLTAAEIIKILSKSNDWSPNTIHTLISRLVKKDAIKVTKEAPFYKYTPIVSQEELRTFETKTFIEKIYKGSLHLLLSTFIQQENLTAEQVEDLKQILKEKSK